MNIGFITLSLIISILAGLIYAFVSPTPGIIERVCTLAKWICLIAFAAFLLGK